MLGPCSSSMSLLLNKQISRAEACIKSFFFLPLISAMGGRKFRLSTHRKNEERKRRAQPVPVGNIVSMVVVT